MKAYQFWLLLVRQWCSGVASGADRHLDITIIQNAGKALPLFPNFLEKHLAIPTSPFSYTSKWFFCYIIREYGSTLYVGLARAVSPTNTNFRLTFLLTRLQEALYEDLAV